MAAWSSVLLSAARKLLPTGGFRTALVKHEQARCMSEVRTMQIRPSIFQWHITKNWLHFYVLVGAIPILTAITLVNIFIGPATLEQIPEGYVPKEWEYLQNPIQRFLQRYIFPSQQQEYEKNLHHVYHENQLRKVKMLERQVNALMAQNQDYRGVYFKESFAAKYMYKYRQSLDDTINRHQTN